MKNDLDILKKLIFLVKFYGNTFTFSIFTLHIKDCRNDDGIAIISMLK